MRQWQELLVQVHATLRLLPTQIPSHSRELSLLPPNALHHLAIAGCRTGEIRFSLASRREYRH